MKYLVSFSIVLSLVAIGYAYRAYSHNSFGATVTSTNSSDTLDTLRTNVNASLNNLNSALISTSSALTAGQVLYATAGNTVASVATSSLAVSAAFVSSGTLGAQIGGTAFTLKASENRSIRYLATSTALFGTTTLAVEVGYGEIWNTVKCFTDVGTLNVQFGYGTASTSVFGASTTVGTITFASNNTMTAGTKVMMEFGTPASSPRRIVCTINDTL